MARSKSRAITILALLVCCAILLIAAFSTLGYFDPTRQGKPIWSTELDPIQLQPKAIEMRWLREELPRSPLSILLTAGHGSGDPDSAYGLLLGQEDNNIAIMISPLGSIAITKYPAQQVSGAADHTLPWQTWPHVQTGDQPNDLLVYLEDDKISVRLNGEFLWAADDIEPVNRLGLIAASYGEEVTIDFQVAEISAVEVND